MAARKIVISIKGGCLQSVHVEGDEAFEVHTYDWDNIADECDDEPDMVDEHVDIMETAYDELVKDMQEVY